MAEDSRTNYGEISPAVCRTQEKPHCQGGPLSVQEYLSAGPVITNCCRSKDNGKEYGMMEFGSHGF